MIYVRLGIYKTFISNVVLLEIRQTPDLTKRGKLLDVIDDYDLKSVSTQDSDEIRFLAAQYLKLCATQPNQK